MNFIRNHYRNQLGNSGKKQISVKSLFVLCFTSGNTKTVFEMIDGFFNIYTYFISGSPVISATDTSRISTKILFRIDVNHPSAERGCTWIITVTDTLGFLGNIVPFPFHFRTDKFHGWKSAA